MRKICFWIVLMVASLFNPLSANVIYDFTDGLGVVCKNAPGQNAYAVIDQEGNQIVPFDKYEWIACYKNGMAICKKNGKYGFLDTEGVLVIPLKYDFATDFNGNYALVREGDEDTGTYYTINKQGKIVHKFSHDLYFGDSYYLQELPLGDGFLLFVTEKDKDGEIHDWYIINHLGKIFTTDRFDNPFMYDGMDGSFVSNEGYENAGRIIVSQAPEFDDDGNLLKGGVYGVLDSDGTILLPLKYSYVRFIGNTIAANTDLDDPFDHNPQNWIRFDLNGDKIDLPYPYLLSEYWGDPADEYFSAISKKTQRFGILDKNLKEVTDFKYYKITEPDKYGFCVAFVDKPGENKFDWYDWQRYHTSQTDLICVNDRRKDRLDIKGFVDYKDGILIVREDGKYLVIDVLTGNTLYTLEKYEKMFSFVNHYVTVVTERNPQTGEDEIRLRNRKGQIIYRLKKR